MALNRADREMLKAEIARALTPEDRRRLAEEVQISADAGGDALAEAGSIVDQAQRSGRLNSLIKALIRAFPGNDVFRGALRRDSRFAGETSPGTPANPVGAALHMRQALQSWGPTLVIPLDPGVRSFATLLAGDAPVLEAPSDGLADPARLLSELGADPQRARILLVTGEATTEAWAQSMVASARSHPDIEVRVVSGIPFLEQGGRAYPAP